MRFARPTKGDILVAAFLYLLNVFDMAATMYAIRAGYGMEMNPLMKFLMDHGMGYFVFVKVVVMLVLTVALLFVYVPKKVNVTLLFLAGMYTMLGISHALIFWSQHAR